jgi:hypothetical protein
VMPAALGDTLSVPLEIDTLALATLLVPPVPVHIRMKLVFVVKAVVS